jgi:membrane protein DedA with SNARE-associated domain
MGAQAQRYFTGILFLRSATAIRCDRFGLQSEVSRVQNVITVAERHGLLIVFLNVLLSYGGLPLPVVPTLMTVAALARQSPYQITQIILAGVSGALIAGVVLYWCGLHYGQRFLALLCKLSFSPDLCVRRTEQVFA